uniref:Uncharacterized protein n=1 Tax=Pipistrellus kuhlii TaxID=59472 RepID=A0A7J8B1U0_PIPKU|nr:hypothetical protein mPipKuh1_007823 [Pipistrellus kuhlii]
MLIRSDRLDKATVAVRAKGQQCERGSGTGESVARASPGPRPLLQKKQERRLCSPGLSAAPSAEAATEAEAQAQSWHHASTEARRGAICYASTFHSPSPRWFGPRSRPTHQWVEDGARVFLSI